MTSILAVTNDQKVRVLETNDALDAQDIASLKIFYTPEEYRAFDHLAKCVVKESESGISVLLTPLVNQQGIEYSFTLEDSAIKDLLWFIHAITLERLKLIKAHGVIAEITWNFVMFGLLQDRYKLTAEHFYLPENPTPESTIDFMVSAVKRIIEMPYVKRPNYCDAQTTYFNKLIPNPTTEDHREDARRALLDRHRKCGEALVIEDYKTHEIYVFSENFAPF